jgi:malonate-semialdehyde dehydrogenase (acetylating) / methylmalonate-semialdehyde dehydrogenase
MRVIDHFIGGSSYASGERQGDVFNPSLGRVQANVRLGAAADLERAMTAAGSSPES